MIFCQYNFLRFLLKPITLSNIQGLILGITSAIIYDVLALITIFVLFFVTVNGKLPQMQHYFYDGVPSFVFEIVIQIYLKKQLQKYYCKA